MTRGALAAVLTGCLALSGALALAAPAEAGIRTFKFGVVSGGPPPGPDVRQMRRVGARTVRVPFNWDAIETRRRLRGASCKPGGLTGPRYGGFGAYDDLMATAGAHDLKLLPMLIGSPSYVGQPTKPPASSNKRAFKDYKCFVRILVKRYGYGGSFVRRNQRADPIRWWQVWNEPNLEVYAPYRNVNPVDYGKLVKLTSRTVKGINPKASIVLAGMPARTSGGVSAAEFLRRLYTVPGIRSAFDVAAIHPYGKNHKEVRRVLESTRDVLRELGDPNRPLWITESGYATSGQDGHYLVKSEKGQASHLERTFGMIRDNHRRFKLGTVLWFNWRDRYTYARAADRKRWTEYAGLYRWNGTPKPSCNRFRIFTGSRRRCQELHTQGPSEGDSGRFGGGGDGILPGVP